MCCRSRNWQAFFLAATLLFTGAAAAQEIGYRDLTQEGPNPLEHKKFQPASTCEGMGGGAVTSCIGCPPATYPFEFSLISLDLTEIAVGGETTALLRLRNVGRDPASVPWISDPDLIELPDDGGTYKFFEADLAADLTQDGRGAHLRVPVHLYGAEEVSGSLLQINPGEWADIKIKLTLDCEKEDCDCKLLRDGPTKLSFTWTEFDRSETYEECSIRSRYIRQRMLTSEGLGIEVIEATQ